MGRSQCEFIPRDLRGSGGLGIHADHRPVHSGTGWGRQLGAPDLPSAPQAPPLLDPLLLCGGVQFVQVPCVYKRWGRDRVPERIKHVPGGESVVVRK